MYNVGQDDGTLCCVGQVAGAIPNSVSRMWIVMSPHSRYNCKYNLCPEVPRSHTGGVRGLAILFGPYTRRATRSPPVMSRYHRLEEDIDHEEEAILRTLEGAEHGDNGVGAAPNSVSGSIDNEPAATATAAATAGANGDELRDEQPTTDRGLMAEQLFRGLPAEPLLWPQIPDMYRIPVQQIAASTAVDVRSRRGVKTYRTTWKDFSRWHESRYGCNPSLIPVDVDETLWYTNLERVTEYISWMGSPAGNKSKNQVCLVSIVLCSE